MADIPGISIFNGDADGIVAQHIFALVHGRPDRRVTGLKRDIHLLRKLPALTAARLDVFDISLRQNRPELDALLSHDGITVDWFDHHDPGEPLAHPRLSLHVNQSPGTCSAVIVDAHLGRKHPVWAALAAYGDNLPVTGDALARAANVSAEDRARLSRAGVLVNYNAYGEDEGDVLYAPASLAERIEPFRSALDFSREESLLAPLQAQFDSDRARCDGLAPAAETPGAAAFLLPDAPWARRFAATWANARVLARPAQALAMLHPNSQGGYVVSLRAPREASSAPSAADLAKEFPTGGGRRLAAGINQLPPAELEKFLARFAEYFR